MPDVNANPIINYTGTIPGAIQGTFAERPAAGYAPGMWYMATDVQILYEWTGSAWVILLSNGGAGGTPTLQQVCTNGNTTNTNIRLLLSSLVFIINNAGNPSGTLSRPGTLTVSRTWTLPDATGIIALTSDIVSQTLQVVTTAGNTSTNDIQLSSANLLFLRTFLNVLQSATTTAIRTWTLPDKSGTVAMTSDIVSQTLQVVTTAGNTSTNDIFLNTSAALKFTRTNVGTLDSTILTANQTWELPNQSGIIALLSDIPSTSTLQAVTTAGNSTNLDIVLTDTAELQWSDSFLGRLQVNGEITADRIWQMPDLDGIVKVIPDVLNNQTGTTFDPVVADNGAHITCTNAATITVTIPGDAAQPFPLGANNKYEQGGAGKITFLGALGVTINSKLGLLSTNGRYVVVWIEKKAPNVWTLWGDLTV